MTRARSDGECGICGAAVSPNAKGCRSCGARKDDTGEWFHAEDRDGLDLVEDDFDYEDFIEREFGEGPVRRSRKDLFWWLVALVTLIAFVLLVVGW